MNFLQKLLAWWINFHQRFFYTAKQHHEIMAIELKKHTDEIDAFDAERDRLIKEKAQILEKYSAQIYKYDQLKEKLDESIDECKKLQQELLQLQDSFTEFSDTIHELKSENMQLKAAPGIDAEYLRVVQKELGRILEQHPGFGYRNHLAIPGSTAVVTGSPSRFGEIPVYGRCVIDDITTREINNAKTQYEKFNIVLNYILRFGAMNRLVQALIQNGAVQFILAYRESTTTYECFFNVNARNFARNATLLFDDTYGLGTVQEFKEYPDDINEDEENKKE